MAAPEFKAKPKGIKGNIVRAVFNKIRPEPTPRDKALSKYPKDSPAFDTQRKLEDRMDAQKTSLSAAERAKVLKNQLKMEAARRQGAPPLQRRQAPAPTPAPTLDDKISYFEDQIKQRKLAEAGRPPSNIMEDVAETVASQQPPKSANIRTGVGDPFARAEAEIKYGRNIPQVKQQGTGGASSEATPIIQRPVGQPKKMSKTKKAALGALIGSPALIPAAAYWGSEDEEEEESPQRSWKEGERDKYLKSLWISIKN